MNYDRGVRFSLQQKWVPGASFGGYRRLVFRANNLATFMCRLCRNSGSLNLLEPSTAVQASTGIDLPLLRNVPIQESCLFTGLKNITITQNTSVSNYIPHFHWVAQELADTVKKFSDVCKEKFCHKAYNHIIINTLRRVVRFLLGNSPASEF